MKIAILTQPIQINYGGIIQAYALRKVLKDMGHDVVIIDRIWSNNKLKYFLQICKSFFLAFISNFFSSRFASYCPTLTVKQVRSSYGAATFDFSRRYLGLINDCFTNSKQLNSYVEKHQIEAIVVGSDQVWRPCYSPCIYDYFLAFLPRDSKIKRIAYAASFGVDNWEFSSAETEKCSDLIHLFNAVSVREFSGVLLCREHFNVDASYVLDPTLLLTVDDYKSLILAENEPKIGDGLFYYLLDACENKYSVVNKLAQRFSLNTFTVSPKDKIVTAQKLKTELENLMIPSVSKWLRAFYDAELVVTDSFHGCVFSIIFNKPFWVILNYERGSDRFNALLSRFKLEDRIIHNINQIDNLSNISIDWMRVNTIWRKEKNKSIDFIMSNL